MTIYHTWCNLKEGVRDMEFVERVRAYFDYLTEQDLVKGYRIMRKQLGLAPTTLPEFHVMIELEDLSQLDRLFKRVTSRAEPVESLHHGVNSLVRDPLFALYRDFPDSTRKLGEEKF